MSTTKYIFVTGGVLSSLGKGIAAASTAALLRQCGFSVSMVKADPYLNVDPGTMSPFEHGEVFVTADGTETDLDLGHYERFINDNLSKKNSFTAGQVYKTVIEQERKGTYLGKTIQVVPHIVDEIKKRIKTAGKDKDFLIVEFGGTVGDIEGLPFMEAIRQIRHQLGSKAVMNIHVTLVPFIKAAGEVKTKPTQHSVQELRRIGVTPHMLMCRTEAPFSKDVEKKIALSCDVDTDAVIEVVDASSIYQVPLNFLKEGMLKVVARHFNLGELEPDMKEWKRLVKHIIEPKHAMKVAFVGKYNGLKEAYKSLTEAFIHCGAALDTRIDLIWIDAEKVTQDNAHELLGECDAICVPGGFGERGVDGKLQAIRYARENRVPYLGICLGMQLAILEYSRHVLNLDADSAEFNPETPNPVIYLIDSFIDQTGSKQVRTHQTPLGGTMRLGEYECDTLDGSLLQKAYSGEKKIFERHRHRYEANPVYRKALEEAGLVVSGESKGLIEAIEIKEHPWFVGVQFHPEFTSKLQNPNKIILSFCKAGLKVSDSKKG